MNLKFQADIDKKLDRIIGPYNNANTVMVRSFSGKWMFPVYTAFDIAISVAMLNEVIMSLEQVGLKILTTTCDQGSRNLGLCRDLGVTKDKPYFKNPFDR